MALITYIRRALLACVLFVAGSLSASAQVTLDLRNADLRAFVEIVAEATGRSYILDPQVNGTVTVLAPEGVAADAVFEIFLNVLELNRLTIVRGSSADRIVPLGTARELTSGQGITLAGGGYETRAIEVRNAPLNEVSEVIRPLLPAEAVLSVVPGAGLLILSDRHENIVKIEALVRQLDQSRAQPVETISLQSGNAPEMLAVIQSLEVTPGGASLSADRRVNALIVSGPAEFRARIRELVGALDVPQRSTVTQVVELNYANATALADVVRRSFAAQAGDTQAAGITIIEEPRTNALLVTAPQDQMSAIIASIRSLDRRPTQVLIEAVIFEMSVENFSDLSVQFGALLNDAVVGGVQFSLEGRPTLTGLISQQLANPNTAPDPGPGGTFGGLSRSGNNSIAGFLSAVASKTSTRLLSTPSIMTLNNQQAEIVVAQNVPFVTGSFATVGASAVPDQPFQTIERQDVGLTLQVTPQITAENTVLMEIHQEVSNLTNSTARAGGEITAKRTLSTNVLVRDGNVIMLGGLLEDGSGSVSQRVPGLGNLPVLGALFRGKNASQNQRVLLVLLRPRVIRTDADATRLSRELANDARRASLVLQPTPDGQYPATPGGAFPFDGADLNQPFDAGFVDELARTRRFPPLPTRLRFVTQ